MGTTPGTALEAPPETPGLPAGEEPQEAQPVQSPAPPSIHEALGAAADATEATFKDEPEAPVAPLEAPLEAEAKLETPETEVPKAPETPPPAEPEELTFADEAPEPSGDVEPLRAIFATGDPNLDDPKTADAIRGAFLKTKSGQNKLVHFQASQKLAEPSNEDGSGGIGFSPGFEEIKGMHEAREDLSRLESDFEDPSRLEDGSPVGTNWMEHWFSPQEDGNLRPGADQIIKAIPQFLAQNNPRLHDQIGTNYVLNYAAQLLDEARGERDETTQKAKDYVGRQLKTLLGQNGQPSSTPPGASDPEMDRLRYERDQAVQHADGIDQSNRVAYEDQILNSLTDATRNDVEEGFKSLKGQYSDYDFDKISSGIVDDVLAELNKDLYYAEGLAARIANSYDRGGMNSLAGAQDEHKARRREVIKRIYRDHRTGIPRTDSEILAESQQRHDQLQTSQEAGDLAPGGKASPRMSVVARAENETQEQHLNRAFDRATGLTFGGR